MKLLGSLFLSQKRKKTHLCPPYVHFQNIKTLLKPEPSEAQERSYAQFGITEDSAQPIEELARAAGRPWLSPELAALQHWALQLCHRAHCDFWLMLLNSITGEV